MKEPPGCESERKVRGGDSQRLSPSSYGNFAGDKGCFRARFLQGRSGILPLIERGNRMPFEWLKIVGEATSPFLALKIATSDKFQPLYGLSLFLIRVGIIG